MNIVPSTASAPTTAPTSTGVTPDGTTGHITPDAGDGVDVPAGNAPAAPQGFGSMLSKHLDDAQGVATTAATTATATLQRGRIGLDLKVQTADAGTGDPADRAADRATDVVPADAAAAASAAANGTVAVVPQDLFPTLAAAATALSGATPGVADGTSRKGRSDDDRKVEGDAASDLAAQLALASQWAGIARPADPVTPTTSAPVDTAVAATVATGAAQGGLDVKSLFGKDRAASGKDDTTPVRTSATSLDAATVATSTAAADTGSGADARQRDERGTPSDQPLAIAANGDAKAADVKAGATKARDEVALAAVDAASAAGAAARTDTVANGDAFALRLAAHAGAAVTGATAATAASTAATAAATSLSSAASAFIQEPVGSTGWSHEVGQATLRMAANDLQSASIRLNPEHLGPLDVQVRVDNGVAHVSFNATHGDTRQALEASRGTLDQIFTSQGLKMGDVSVGSGASGGSNDAAAARRDASADASRRDGGNTWSGDDTGADGDGPVTTVTTRIARALGLVDTFA